MGAARESSRDLEFEDEAMMPIRFEFKGVDGEVEVAFRTVAGEGDPVTEVREGEVLVMPAHAWTERERGEAAERFLREKDHRLMLVCDCGPECCDLYDMPRIGVVTPSATADEIREKLKALGIIREPEEPSMRLPPPY